MSHSINIFDNLECLSAPKAEDLHDELDKYLSTDPEHVVDAVKWWFDRRKIYPRLSRMAMDYLTIPRKYSDIGLLLLFHCLFPQLLPLMWSVRFRKAAFFYRICVTAYLLNRRAHSFASGCGVR
jgi:hypothetical protein